MYVPYKWTKTVRFTDHEKEMFMKRAFTFNYKTTLSIIYLDFYVFLALCLSS